MFSINQNNDIEKYGKLMKDIPLNIDRDDEEDFKEEDIIAKEAIAYYPSLKVPENNDNDIDSDIVKVNYTDKSGYIDKIYLHKTNKMSNISEVYKLSINENTKKAQIGNSSLSEMVNEIGSTHSSFKIKFPKGFNLRSKPEVIQESFNSMPSINEEWLTETINNELRLVRGLLTVFKENDMILFEDDFNEYYVSMNWVLNSPILENVETYNSKNDSSEEFSNEINEAFRIIFGKNNIELMDMVNYISDNIVSQDISINNMTEEDVALNIISALYHGLGHRKISKTSETLHMVALFYYMRNFLRHDNISLLYVFKDSLNALDYGKLIIQYYGDDDSLSYIYITKDGDDHRDICITNDMSHLLKNNKVIGISDLTKDISDQLFHTEFNTVGDIINLLFFSESSKNVYIENYLTENILNENTTDLRRKIMAKINKVYKHLDKTGLNGEAVRQYWDSMSDTKFMSEMKKFINDDEANFTLEVLPNKNEPSLTDIKNALKAINVPENEYVYFRHLEGTENDPVRTRYKVPVGYIHIRRLRAKCFIERYLKISRLMRGLVLILNYLEDSLLSTY